MKKNRKKTGRPFLRDLFKKKPLAAASLIFLLLLFAAAIFADFIAPYPMTDGAMQVDVFSKLQKPYLFMNAAERESARALLAVSGGTPHWLGTDTLGRDVLSYLIYGARTSIILCVSCCVLSTLISVVIGTLSAVLGGWVDLIVQRFVDGWQCIPAMLMLLVIMSMLGNGIPQLIFALSVPSGIGGSRMIRSAAMGVKDAGYNKMSDLMGGTSGWKMLRHVVPNILPIIIVAAAGSLAGVILMESSLSFLGYGVAIGTPSWGYLISNQGKSYMFVAPWLAFAPGAAIALTVFAANMFGDGVRDLLDPRLRGGVGSYDSKKIAKKVARLTGVLPERVPGERFIHTSVKEG